MKPGEDKAPRVLGRARGSAAGMQNRAGLHARSPFGAVHFLTRCGQGGNCTRWVGEG